MNKYSNSSHSGAKLRDEFDITTCVDDALSKLKDVAEGKIRPYDAIVTIFGESRRETAEGAWKFQWKQLIDGMRTMPHKSQTPFIVYSSDWNELNRRKLCMQYGAYDFTTTFPELFNALARLLDDSDIEDPDIKSYTYDL
jgi:hypothetical protein